ncbi:MAG: M28 family peptidase [Flavobacteriales bacterium]
MRSALPWIMVLSCAVVQAQDDAAILARGRQHVDSLTSPGFHGRGYVNNGQGVAADYIARAFERMGLQPVKNDYYQPFTFNVNSFPDSIGAQVDGQVLTPGTDYLVHPASGSAEGSFELVHLTAADLFSAERKAMTLGVVTGKAAVLHWPATKNADSLARFAQLEEELMHYGPVVKVVRGKLTWSVAQEARPYPLLEVKDGFVSDSSAVLDLRVRNRMLARNPARNVLGMVKGRGKGWVIIGAHYDHLGRMGPDALFPGANDNASGVAMMLELAQWFSTHKPKHNLLFVAFAGEEAGLVGSEWFAVDRPIDLSKVKLMLNLDILGTGDDGVMAVNATAEQALYDRLVAVNTKGGFVKEVRVRGPACNSDHCPLVKRGVPALFLYTLGGAAHYHDVNDTGASLTLKAFAPIHALLRTFIAQVK